MKRFYLKWLVLLIVAVFVFGCLTSCDEWQGIEGILDFLYPDDDTLIPLPGGGGGFTPVSGELKVHFIDVG